jgi:hypothetical protein
LKPFVGGNQFIEPFCFTIPLSPVAHILPQAMYSAIVAIKKHKAEMIFAHFQKQEALLQFGRINQIPAYRKSWYHAAMLLYFMKNHFPAACRSIENAKTSNFK